MKQWKSQELAVDSKPDTETKEPKGMGRREVVGGTTKKRGAWGNLESQEKEAWPQEWNSWR